MDDTFTSEDQYGNKYWYDKNGMLHREDGPAIVYIDGTYWWFIHGKQII